MKVNGRQWDINVALLLINYIYIKMKTILDFFFMFT